MKPLFYSTIVKCLIYFDIIAVFIICVHVPNSLLVPEQYCVHSYVDGDVVSFVCLSDMNPTDLINATCTMEGSGRPDLEMLNCISTTEETTTSDGIQCMLYVSCMQAKICMECVVSTQFHIQNMFQAPSLSLSQW